MRSNGHLNVACVCEECNTICHQNLHSEGGQCLQVKVYRGEDEQQTWDHKPSLEEEFGSFECISLMMRRDRLMWYRHGERIAINDNEKSKRSECHWCRLKQ